jgi:hypothetical protein
VLSLSSLIILGLTTGKNFDDALDYGIFFNIDYYENFRLVEDSFGDVL